MDYLIWIPIALLLLIIIGYLVLHFLSHTEVEWVYVVQGKEFKYPLNGCIGPNGERGELDILTYKRINETFTISLTCGLFSKKELHVKVTSNVEGVVKENVKVIDTGYGNAILLCKCNVTVSGKYEREGEKTIVFPNSTVILPFGWLKVYNYKDEDHDGLVNFLEGCGSDTRVDSDGDKLTDYQEVMVYHTSPCSKDTDKDGLSDYQEVTVYHSNPKNPDSDGDKLSDYEEVKVYHTNPLSPDTDNDGLSDYEEIMIYHTNPLKRDTDGDGLSDGQEIKVYHSNPFNPDTDGDGVKDGLEVAKCSSPLKVDTDGDKLTDYQEIFVYHTSPCSKDTDKDGLSDYEEIFVYHTNPLKKDTDNDGLSDYEEIKVYHTNPLKKDTDGDGLIDGLEIKLGSNPFDPDTDKDGLLDGFEYKHCSSPVSKDTDKDGLPDPMEIKVYHTSPCSKDTDRDGLSDYEEIKVYHTNPLNSDTDGDKLTDGKEIKVYHTNPLKKDTDGDGLIDGAEVLRYHTNPLRADTDEDGLSDGVEVLKYHTNPLKRDTDCDGLTDYQEVKIYHTNPLKKDTDEDGIDDGNEIRFGTDPLVPQFVVIFKTFTGSRVREVFVTEDGAVSVSGNCVYYFNSQGKLLKRVCLAKLNDADHCCGRVGLVGNVIMITDERGRKLITMPSLIKIGKSGYRVDRAIGMGSEGFVVCGNYCIYIPYGGGHRLIKIRGVKEVKWFNSFYLATDGAIFKYDGSLSLVYKGPVRDFDVCRGLAIVSGTLKVNGKSLGRGFSAVSFSPDCYYVSAIKGKTLYIFNKHGKLILKRPIGEAVTLDWGRSLALGYLDGEVYAYKVQDLPR